MSEAYKTQAHSYSYTSPYRTKTKTVNWPHVQNGAPNHRYVFTVVSLQFIVPYLKKKKRSQKDEMRMTKASFEQESAVDKGYARYATLRDINCQLI